jgi:hypothetical protein
VLGLLKNLKKGSEAGKVGNTILIASALLTSLNELGESSTNLKAYSFRQLAITPGQTPNIIVLVARQTGIIPSLEKDISQLLKR